MAFLALSFGELAAELAGEPPAAAAAPPPPPERVSHQAE